MMFVASRSVKKNWMHVDCTEPIYWQNGSTAEVLYRHWMRFTSSHKRRTFQTVLPTAMSAGLDVQQLPADGTELNPESTSPSECLTIDAILNTPPGDTILVGRSQRYAVRHYG